MIVVVDTSVVIDALRQVGPATRYLERLPRRAVCSEVTRAEVWRGVRSQERDQTERLFEAIDWVHVDDVVSRRAGELGRTYRRSHPGLGLADLLVAGTVVSLGAELATLNVRHFPMFPGLRPLYR
ncbi:MAG: type II toxin-antitoxin system VapC family toxin [Acidimicrobiales bacterium]